MLHRTRPMKAASRVKAGADGEELVANYLEQAGYKILARNYRLQCGEIDLIAQKNKTIAFVEVKARLGSSFDLSEVITRAKQKKIIATASYFIAQQRSTDYLYRFDVALIENLENKRISYISNAFNCHDQ